MTVTVIIEILVVVIVVDREMVVSHITEEYSEISEWMGKDISDTLISDATDTYEKWFVDTGLIRASMRLVTPDAMPQASDHGMSHVGEPIFPLARGFIDTFWSSIYQGVVRFKMLSLWAPYLLPMLLCAIVDGMNSREVKKHSYGYTSTNWYVLSLYSLIILVIGVPALLILPISMPIWATPAWYFGATAGLILLFSNLQKMY